MENKELTTTEPIATDLATMSAEEFAQRAALFNILANPDERLRDHINKTLNIVNASVEEVSYTDELTGEIKPGVRIILIDADGKSYVTGSTGVYNSLNRLTAMFGAFPWAKPVPLKVKQITKGKMNILTFVIDC